MVFVKAGFVLGFGCGGFVLGLFVCFWFANLDFSSWDFVSVLHTAFKVGSCCGLGGFEPAITDYIVLECVGVILRLGVHVIGIVVFVGIYGCCFKCIC